MRHTPFSLGFSLCCLLGAALLVAPVRAQGPSRSRPPAAPMPAGPFAPGVDTNAFWDGRGMVPFHALDLPKMVSAKEADFLDPDDYVLGVTVGGESRAYPTRFLWWHHVINDRVTVPGKGDVAFAVTYCSVCNSGARYDLNLDGKPIHLDFYGLYNGVVALCDRETGSVFVQESGQFANGALAGRQLKDGPILDTTWAEWTKLHPDTRVMSPDTAYSKYYNPKGHPEPRGYDRFPAPFFGPTVARVDKRLPAFDKVLGVAVTPTGGTAADPPIRRAYPIKALLEAGDVVNETVGTAPIAVFVDPDTLAASAVSRRLDGRTLTFEARKTDGKSVAFYDKETGTHWSIEGAGLDGPLAGKSLDRVNNHLSQWYGWYANFPATTIYGGDDAPQPGELFGTLPARKSSDEVRKP